MFLNVLIFFVAIAVVSFLLGPTAIWFFRMRPYIRKKGKNPATGANWGYSQLLDFSAIFAICRDSHERIPWFIYVWVGINLFWILLPIFLFIKFIL